MKLLQELWSDDQGQDVVEYGLIAALVSTLAIVGIQGFGQALSPLWTRIATTISGV